jgi:hypothetical protein
MDNATEKGVQRRLAANRGSWRSAQRRDQANPHLNDDELRSEWGGPGKRKHNKRG